MLRVSTEIKVAATETKTIRVRETAKQKNAVAIAAAQ